MFLLTFWAMYFLMVLYTFLANLAFHLGNQGATTSWQMYIFAATTLQKEGKKEEALVVAVVQVDTVTVLTLARWPPGWWPEAAD